MGKILITVGIIIVLIGMSISMGIKIPFVGKLPGDIIIKRENFVFYFPLVTSIILSLILTFFLNLFTRR